jgi:gluconolactonase
MLDGKARSKPWPPLTVAIAALALAGVACATGSPPSPEAVHDEIGSIEQLDPALGAVVAPDARVEVLARGFGVPEGPVWDPDAGQLLFSDVGRDVIWRWRDGEGLSAFLRGTGDPGHRHDGGLPGTNGLAVDAEGRLLACDHGGRQVARLGKRGFEPLATRFAGKRLNSPNDLAVHPNGDVYFTDPPWGLDRFGGSKDRELPFSGVYRVRPDREVELVARDLEPNGVAIAPDGRTLYVSHRRSVVAIALGADGAIGERRTLLAMRHLDGMLDGLTVDTAGHLFVASPIGVLVLSPEGRHLGTLRTGAPATNCEIGDDGRSLYVTAGDFLGRVRLASGALASAGGGAP